MRDRKLPIRTNSLFEVSFASSGEHADPLHDVRVTATIAAPDGRTTRREAFWDGGQTWLLRISPDVPGVWRYRTACAEDPGLDGQVGEFVTDGTADASLFAHGRITLTPDRRRFMHVDGTPWFWMADTAWSGLLKATAEDWDRYLGIRAAQGFTAVQTVLTQWRGCPADTHGETAYTGTERISLNPAFFARLDPLVAAINAHGLVAGLVLLWAITEGDPGYSLPDDEAIRLARYLVARYGAHQVVWFLGGDGNYQGEKAEKWRRVGPAVFAGDNHDRLVTMHPQGQHWVADEFRDQPWFDFVSYQSGHGTGPQALRFFTEGPLQAEWRTDPPRPIVDLEPCYEAHGGYEDRQPITPAQVRRATYWGLLMAPTAGVTYSHHGTWPWMTERGVPHAHPRTGEAPPWHEAVEAEGAAQIAHLRAFFDVVGWPHLLPAPELLLDQPGANDPEAFIACARRDDGVGVVAYLPRGGSVLLDPAGLPPDAATRWCNPRTGAWLDGDASAGATFTAPDAGDWLLWVCSA
jgi:hypothetical protein